MIEVLVVERSRFSVDRDIVERHRQYWNTNTIQTLWFGDSFYSPSEGQELIHHLAEELSRNLMSDDPTHALAFLNTAAYADAGNDALIRTCGTSLGRRVTSFLGGGNWQSRTDD